MREAESSLEQARRLVADDQPCRSWQPFVDHFGNNTDVGIAVGSCDEGTVNVGNPELGKRRIHRG